jgi:hypothetical protein
VHTSWGRFLTQVESGQIVCARRVYQEIAEAEDHKDELAQWVKVRKEKGLCIPPSRGVQELVAEIEAYAFEEYLVVEAWEFSKGADPWLIASALDDGGVVVTNESDLRPEAKKVRIPDICSQFDVKCVDTLVMLKELKAKF